jgi:integrase
MRLLARSDAALDQVTSGRLMAEACKGAKIELEISFHVFRDTWGSLAVMAGIPLLVVARNLGHADHAHCLALTGHGDFVLAGVASAEPRIPKTVLYATG